MNFQTSESVGLRPKTGPNVKAILQSIKTSPYDENTRTIACNPAKMFKSLIQRANDSGSMDSSFEHKTLPRPALKQAKNSNYVNELRQVLKENKNVESASGKKSVTDEINVTPSKLPFTNRKNISGNHIIVPKSLICEKHSKTPLILERKMPNSSTPYRSKAGSTSFADMLAMTPPNSKFIDFELESPDSSSDTDLDRTLVKCFSLTKSSCRRLASFRKRDKNEMTSPQFKRRTTLSSSFAANGSVNETSPIQRQQRKNSKLRDSFRAIIKPREMHDERHTENDLTQTCTNLAQFIERFDDTESELLSEHNIDLHNNESGFNVDLERTINEADGKVEFSFICEPSSSDIEDDLNVPYPNVMKCDIVRDMPSIESIAPSIESSHSSILLTNILNSSPFRRSISDPSLVRLANESHRSSADYDTVSVDLQLRKQNAVSLSSFPTIFGLSFHSTMSRFNGITYSNFLPSYCYDHDIMRMNTMHFLFSITGYLPFHSWNE